MEKSVDGHCATQLSADIRKMLPTCDRLFLADRFLALQVLIVVPTTDPFACCGQRVQQGAGNSLANDRNSKSRRPEVPTLPERCPLHRLFLCTGPGPPSRA